MFMIDNKIRINCAMIELMLRFIEYITHSGISLTSSIILIRKSKRPNILRIRFNTFWINGNGSSLFGDPLPKERNILKITFKEFWIKGNGFCLFGNPLSKARNNTRIRFNAFQINGNGFCLFGDPLPQIYI